VRKSAASPNPYVPIIMVTGHTEKHRIEAARDAGVTEVLAKPITAGNLIQRITEIVNRPRGFVRSGEYFGPDRRRRQVPEFRGPFRRCDDADDIAIQ
jgi:DNA-binding response OmpR family regulator